jgi:hypothetical protein
MPTWRDVDKKNCQVFRKQWSTRPDTSTTRNLSLDSLERSLSIKEALYNDPNVIKNLYDGGKKLFRDIIGIRMKIEEEKKKISFTKV